MTHVVLILPLYKPHGHWELPIIEAYSNLRTYFQGRDIQFSLFINNDGAPLSYYPEEKLNALKELIGHFQFIPYDTNHGKGYALRFAVARSTGDFYIYTDGDFPFGWESIAQITEHLLNGDDIVMGNRDKGYSQALNGSRRFISQTVHTLNHLLLGLPQEISDTQSGIKGFNAKGKEWFLKTTIDGFIFDMEFILISHKATLRIGTIPLTLRTGITFTNFKIKTLLKELLQFFKLLWNIRILRKSENK